MHFLTGFYWVYFVVGLPLTGKILISRVILDFPDSFRLFGQFFVRSGLCGHGKELVLFSFVFQLT